MGLFKRKKEKTKEEINLVIKNVDDELFSQNIQEQEKIVEKKSTAQLENDIISNYQSIISKNEKMMKDYYICKIFSRVGLRDLEFNFQIISIDKNVNRIKKECFNIKRKADLLQAGLKLNESEVEMLHKQVLDLKAFQIGVMEQLTELNNGSFGHLKISTVTVTINKSIEELEVLYNSITNEVGQYKSFDEASEYIYYNSGEFIENIVNSFINCVKETTNEELVGMYNKLYFLPSDAVISLDVKEWIELYNKLKFVLKQIVKYNTVSYTRCYDLFNIFEAKYAILMMRSERRIR